MNTPRRNDKRRSRIFASLDPFFYLHVGDWFPSEVRIINQRDYTEKEFYDRARVIGERLISGLERVWVKVDV